jgi:class 3 adenylate cyclase
VEKYGGRVVKTVGDSVMAAFDEPDMAARAAKEAVELTRALDVSEVAHKGIKQLTLRVGCHVGPCIAITNTSGQLDYFGNTVNIASRVESIGEGNDVTLTQFVSRTSGSRQWLKEIERTGRCAISSESVSVKGITGEVRITRIKVL